MIRSSATVTEPSTAEGDGIWQIIRWSAVEWPPGEPQLLQSFPLRDDHQLQLGFTAAGNVLILRLDPKGIVLQTFQSQPLEFEGEGYLRIAIHWGREGIYCRFGSHDLQSLHECSEPARIVFKEMEVWPVKSYDATERHLACERQVRLRSKRVPEAGADDRVLSLSEEIENLRDGVKALAEDAERVRAGEKHRANAMRAAIRELVTDLGQNYRPALIRVAGLLSLPLPIYAIPKGMPVAVTGLMPTTSGFNSDPPRCTKRFSTEQIIDFSEWQRRKMLVLRSRRDPYTFDEVIANSANFLGGGHSPPAIPREIDRMARTTLAGLDANTRFLLGIADVITELGQYVLRVFDTPEAERCTERASAGLAEAGAKT
jgi:hypothetical protein